MGSARLRELYPERSEESKNMESVSAKAVARDAEGSSWRGPELETAGGG